MAHIMRTRPLTRAALAGRGPWPDYRKTALLNTVRLALAMSRQSQVSALHRRSILDHKPKLVPAASLPWYRKATLVPNRSMWTKPRVAVADLSSAFDKMTLDSVPRGAVDELSDSLGKLSVQDVPPSAIDELSAAFERLSLNDPVIEDLTASFGDMTLEQRSASLDDLARLLGQCSLDDDCVSEVIAIHEPSSSPGTLPLKTTGTISSTIQVNVEKNDAPTASETAADVNAEPDHLGDLGCLPPLSVSDFATGDILPLGTRPEEWIPAAESLRAIERVHLADGARSWTPFMWGQDPMLSTLVNATVDRRPVYGSFAPRKGVVPGFLGRLFSVSTSSRAPRSLLPTHQHSVSSFSPNASTSSASSTYSGHTSISDDAPSDSSASVFSVDLSSRNSSPAPGLFSKLKRVFGWSA